jgi:hypothetical protein
VRSASRWALNNPQAEQSRARRGERNCAGTGESRYHHACAFSLPPSIQHPFVCVFSCFTHPLCFTRPDLQKGRAHACFQIQYQPDQGPRAHMSYSSTTLSTTFCGSSDPLLVVPNLKDAASYYYYIYNVNSSSPLVQAYIMPVTVRVVLQSLIDSHFSCTRAVGKIKASSYSRGNRNQIEGLPLLTF